MVTDVRLMGPALVMWAIAGIGLRAPGRGLVLAGLVVVLCCALAGSKMLIRRRSAQKPMVRGRSPECRGRVTAGVVLLLLVALFGFRIALENFAVSESGLKEASEIGLFGSGQLRITSDARPINGAPIGSDLATAGEYWFTAEIIEFTTHLGTTRLPRVLRVFGKGSVKDVPDYGSAIEVEGTLALARPGEKSLALLQLTRPAQLISTPRGITNLTNQLRKQLVELVAPMSPQSKALVPGAAIGDTRAMTPEQADEMRATGLTHITAVSGSHFAVLFMVISTLTRRLPLVLRGTLIAAACLGFVALVHPSGAVLRALVMGLVAVLALVRKRRGQGFSALGGAMIVLLLIDPYLANDFGFILSVLATGGLIALSSPLTQFIHRPRRDQVFLPKSVALIIAVPIAAQASVGPALLLLEPVLPLYSVLANIVAAPALAPAMMLGLMATVLTPISPNVAYVFAQLASGPTWWISSTAKLFAAFPAASVPWLEGPVGAVLLAMISLLVGWLCLAIHRGDPWTHPRRTTADKANQFAGRWNVSLARRIQEAFVIGAVRKEKAWLRRLGMAITLALLCSCVFLVRPLWLISSVRVGELGANWQVAACDVGQGDAFVVRGADSKVYMIDVGPDPYAARACLVDLGVPRIDFLFISHLHADHYGGLEAVVRHTEVGNVVTGPLVESNEASDYVFGVAREYGVPAVALGSKGAISALGSGGRLPLSPSEASTQGAWRVLWPSVQEVSNLASSAELGQDTTNNLSMTISLDLGDGVRVAFLGDLEADGQERMAAWWRGNGSSDQLRHDIVKMAHHGSASQSPQLADLLSPDLTLVGVGSNNEYGHPTRTAIELYQKVGSRVLATHECGTFGVYQESERWFVVGACP